jgi:hypothetical protein
MTDFDAAVAGVVDALEIDSALNFSWFGRLNVVQVNPSEPSPSAVRTLCDTLAERLYSDFYVHGQARPSGGDAAAAAAPSNHGFLQALRSANRSSSSQQSGWIIKQLLQDAALVERDGLTLLARGADILRPLPPHQLGRAVTIRFPAELLNMAPGFYTALGRQELVLDPGRRLTRVYWHLSPEAGPCLVSELTERLNHDDIPFRLKASSAPWQYDRCDAAVLYLSKSSWAAAAPVIRIAAAAIHAHLLDGSPAFTKPLTAGIGVADGAESGGSFGLDRCALLARCLVQGHLDGVRSPAQQLEHVRAGFVDSGVDPDQPHLGSGERDIYEAMDLH